MTVIRLGLFLSVLILFFMSRSEADTSNEFKMLESYLISGLVPDIEDGYGVAFRDFTADGYPDIYLVCFKNLNRLLINNGGIIPFVDRTIFSGLGGYLMTRGESNLELGANAADYDNDGKPDLFLAGWGMTHKLFHNLGGLAFEDATKNLNLRGIVDANQGIWFDADNDGFLDLYITDEHRSNRLFMNKKNGFFDEVLWTESFADTAVSQGGLASDFDSDGDMDLYIANWFVPDYLLENDGKGLFKKIDLNLPTLTQAFRSNSAATGDIDNDGDMDLIVSTKDGSIFLYRNQSDQNRIQFTWDSKYTFNFNNNDAYGVLLEDFNNDGWLDCFFSLYGENRLMLNDQMGGFQQEADSDHREANSTGAAPADFDLDGDLDIFVANKNAFGRVYLNPTNDQQFIFIKLIGVVSNRDAVGARLFFYQSGDTLKKLIGSREVTDQCGYLSSKDPVVHFGTGGNHPVDVKIRFPSGKEQLYYNLKPGTRYTFSEYNTLISKILFSLNTIRYQVNRNIFWLNFGLLIIFLIIIWIHISLGINRYELQVAGMAAQLIIWFVLSLIIFLLFRAAEMHTILTALNSASLVGFLIVAGYSEHLRSLKLRRKSFRDQIQRFSEQMINYHDNESLFSRLAESILKHVDIRKAVILFNEDGALFLFGAGGAESAICCTLNPDEIQSVLRRNIIDLDDALIESVFTEQKLNAAIPIKHENFLYGLIGVDMENRKSPLNIEDIQLLQTIANQTAIAIENNNYIKASAELIRQLTEAKLREEYTHQLEKTNRELDQKNAELTKLFRELQDKEAQLVHSEKMASLGQLVAGISHELNNPISFIYANSQTLSEYLDEVEKLWAKISMDDNHLNQVFFRILSELKSIIRDNINGSRSVKELVLSLKDFSRLDQAGWKDAKMITGLENSLKVLQSQITKEIEIIRDFKDDPVIFCNPGQLNQVFVNLISNALQALEGKGKIFIRTKIEHDALLIEIEDTGTGIKEEFIPKIFDPFFTTKDVSKGTGLGLSISYSIIQKHKGELKVRSKVGKGSTFTIMLPLKT